MSTDEPTAEDYAALKAHERRVHEHNVKMLEEHNIPSGGHSPRRGFFKATSGLYFIVEIERRERPVTARAGEEHYWIATTAYDLEAYQAGKYTSTHAYIIGPRGRMRKAY